MTESRRGKRVAVGKLLDRGRDSHRRARRGGGLLRGTRSLARAQKKKPGRRTRAVRVARRLAGVTACRKGASSRWGSFKSWQQAGSGECRWGVRSSSSPRLAAGDARLGPRQTTPVRAEAASLREATEAAAVASKDRSARVRGVGASGRGRTCGGEERASESPRATASFVGGRGPRVQAGSRNIGSARPCARRLCAMR